MFLHSVAPKELIRADYAVLKSYEHLETSPEIEDLIFMQSLEGRAHNGAGVFKKRNYVNTSIDDVVKALDREPNEIKARRQKVIDDISDFASAVMHGERRDRLVNMKGEPFLGIQLFAERRVNARDILRGLYMGGLRDNPDIRKEAEKIYQIKIGGGRCYIIDVKTMVDMNFDGELLAHEPHEHEIESFRQSGLIVGTEGPVNDETQRYFYIRHRLGPGQSDDAAMIMAGILYNVDVAFGVFLADAIDTLEKYAPTYHDQDGNLSFQIGRGFKDLQLTMEDVYELVSLAAIPELEEDMVPDSSLRYLLSIDSTAHQSAFRSHLDFVEAKPHLPLPVSFKKIPSAQFYEYINRRLINVRKLEKLAVPALTVNQLDKSVVDFIKKDFLLLPKEATLSDVIHKFKESKAELIIIQDKNNRVLGTISPYDLLQYLNESGSNHART